MLYLTYWGEFINRILKTSWLLYHLLTSLSTTIKCDCCQNPQKKILDFITSITTWWMQTPITIRTTWAWFYSGNFQLGKLELPSVAKSQYEALICLILRTSGLNLFWNIAFNMFLIEGQCWKQEQITTESKCHHDWEFSW